MSYTNSSLVSYTKISPNRGNTIKVYDSKTNTYKKQWSPDRTHVIDTISIHCVAAQASIESLGRRFADDSVGASSNYGIGSDGRIGMYVEEKDRSWCTSSASNDNRAITIEVASDSKDPYAVNDKAYASLIALLVDVCERNGIEELRWKGDKNLIGNVEKQNMTVHRWFANKACPGDYLYGKMTNIAAEVNATMKANKEKKMAEEKKKSELEESIEIVKKYGIMMGYTDGEFHGTDKLTRNQAAIMFARFLKIMGKE